MTKKIHQTIHAQRQAEGVCTHKFVHKNVPILRGKWEHFGKNTSFSRNFPMIFLSAVKVNPTS